MFWIFVFVGGGLLFGGGVYAVNRKPYQEFKNVVAQMDLISRANGRVAEVRTKSSEFYIIKFASYPDFFWALLDADLPDPFLGDLYYVELRDTSLWAYTMGRKPRFWIVERFNQGY